LSTWSGVTGWNYRRGFNHQYDRSIGRSSAVYNALRNDEPFSRLQVNRFAFQVDNEVAIEHKEELVVVIVLMPVVLALHHAQANNGIVNFAQCLVVPLVRARLYKRGNINDREGPGI
jgi:hypothetical protein